MIDTEKEREIFKELAQVIVGVDSFKIYRVAQQTRNSGMSCLQSLV